MISFFNKTYWRLQQSFIWNYWATSLELPISCFGKWMMSTLLYSWVVPCAIPDQHLANVISTWIVIIPCFTEYTYIAKSSNTCFWTIGAPDLNYTWCIFGADNALPT